MGKLNTEPSVEEILQLEEVQSKFQELNLFFGHALERLTFPDHKVLGRDSELNSLTIIMARKTTPVALLLGEAGVGKTDIVESWNEQESKKGHHIYLYTLAVGALAADGINTLQQRMEALMPRLKRFEQYLQTFDGKAEVILFIDEVHTVISIFGRGTKIGGDLLKRSLARNYIRVITATTRIEYDTYIANDGPLARRFKTLEINEVGPDTTLIILKQWLKKHGNDQDSDENVSETLLKQIIQANHLYRQQFAEPAKSIDVVESALAIHDVEKIPITFDTIKRVFDSQYNIKLDTHYDTDAIHKNITRRVKGQPLAIHTLDRLVKKMSMPLERSNRPLATALFVGPTGVGKTEATKALAEAIYGSEDKIINLNMPDFGLASSEPDFRRTLGTAVYHEPSAIVLLDELEKANLTVKQTLLPVIDEGRVSYEVTGQDGYQVRQTVSLKNTIIIGTSNAGHDFFDQAAKFLKDDDKQKDGDELTRALKREWGSNTITMIQALQAETDFTPEFLGRFQEIIPFLSLVESTLAKICDNFIFNYQDKLERRYGIKIEVAKPQNWEKDYLHFISTDITALILSDMLSEDDTKSGGARNVRRLVDSVFYGPVLDAIYDPENRRRGIKRFKATLNGKASFQGKFTAGEGEVIITPVTYSAERR